MSVFGQLPLGFIFAYLIYRKIVRFGEFWQGVLYMPAIISVIVLGIMWGIIFSPTGLIADVMNKLYANGFSRRVDRAASARPGGLRVSDELVKGIVAASDPKALTIFTDPVAELKDLLLTYDPLQLDVLKSDLANLLAKQWTPDFLAKRDLAMLPIMFVVLWCWTGMYLILFLASMQKIEVSILEAARIDGAGEGQVMGLVVLPLLSGVIVNAAILCIAGSLNSFALVYAMTGGGPARVTQLLSIYMYENAFVGTPNFPLANAIAMSIVIFSIVLIVLHQARGAPLGREGVGHAENRAGRCHPARAGDRRQGGRLPRDGHLRPHDRGPARLARHELVQVHPGVPSEQAQPAQPAHVGELLRARGRSASSAS